MLQPSGDLPAIQPLEKLSDREREVLGMVALGLSNQDVAARLYVTVHAVKFHLAAIYRKLGVSNRTEAALVYVGAAGMLGGGR